ncbi:uncharacterized protein EV420DRAFT_1752435 [Desarmillaria tabescens]|uniref:Uncharacterized protein n=1 Tax=Armillaria tabescens TaxID=1929756 RepID=A0AA39JJT7_ARMTA|nr:uncharacterized protein EV420DRAFT_1752435 [Desarmillaria tabescens]KAK0441778.1 hypothetical protein EV420DRAFT_1752435 [Desarmillaria tabescens]
MRSSYTNLAKMRKTLLQYEMRARTSNKPGSGAKPKPMGRSCRAAFIPILKSKCPSIEQTTRGTHQYGPTDRHMLDVKLSQHPDPRLLPRPLIHYLLQLGSFFASRGFITVVPDYCFVDSSVKFPGTAQDMRDAIRWVMDNLLRVSYDEFVAKGHNHVSLMFALGTRQGEEWAEDAVKWIHARREPH